MKSILSAFFAVLIGAVGAAYGQTAKAGPVTTVPSVDLKRYAGQWYEIARYPNKFQKNCVGNTTATYAIKSSERVEVTNRCVEKDGTTNTAVGEAKIVKGSNNTKLKVRFAPGFLSFLSAVWGDYWVLDLADDYSYAAVGDPKREYLWILSREPELSDATYQAILRRVEAKGFEPGKLQKTSQKVEVLKGDVLEKH